jgi:hypothetical protein
MPAIPMRTGFSWANENVAIAKNSKKRLFFIVFLRLKESNLIKKPHQIRFLRKVFIRKPIFALLSCGAKFHFAHRLIKL